MRKSANSFLNQMTVDSNITRTENGGVTRKSTESKVLDMFALGGSYRGRSEEDVILLFKNAYEEDPTLAMKCLFYLRDIRGGQGERRFFRTAFHWLCNEHPEVAMKNLENVSEYGRWDDLIYTTVNTPVEFAAFTLIKHQLALDVQCKTPSLLAKWMPSQNASSVETKQLGYKLANFLNMSSRQYRKTLSILRERINVLERLMSANRWDEIEFDKIPSRAGLIYRNAFAKRDMIKAKYEAFAKDSETKVNAKTLTPVDIAHQCFYTRNPSDTDRAMLDKYWENQPDFYEGREERGIAVCDVSGSMTGIPMEAAVSMGAYVAERGKGPFKNHFITFSGNPELVHFDGVDIYDKFNRARSADWGMNTNIEAVMKLLLNTAIKNNCSADEIPTRIYIFSDMQFDSCMTTGRVSTDRWGWGVNESRLTSQDVDTFFEAEKKKWQKYGFSMNMVQCILSGKSGFDLMMLKLNSDRYKPIH